MLVLSELFQFPHLDARQVVRLVAYWNVQSIHHLSTVFICYAHSQSQTDRLDDIFGEVGELREVKHLNFSL